MTYGPKPRPLLERLEAKVRVESDGHLRWTAAKDPKGYGRFTVGKTGKMAHRVVYAETVGPIPDGMEVDHICGQRDCVNPRHLRLLTPDQNKQYRHEVDARSTSGYPGVHWDKRRQKWRAGASLHGRSVWLGYHQTPEAAYQAWKAWAATNMPYAHQKLTQL